MRQLIPFFCLICFALPAAAQEKPEVARRISLLANALEEQVEIKVLPTDDRVTQLSKQLYRAAHEEFRTKYNYWLQGYGSIDDTLGAAERFQAVRNNVEPNLTPEELLQEQIELAQKMEKETETLRAPHSQAVYRELGETAIRTYRLTAELKLERLKTERTGAISP